MGGAGGGGGAALILNLNVYLNFGRWVGSLLEGGAYSRGGGANLKIYGI